MSVLSVLDPAVTVAHAVVSAIAHVLPTALAIVLFASIRERLDLTSKCPKCFEGFPIALVSAALLAMSFMGFSGLQVFK